MASATYGVDENAGTVVLSVTRTGGSSGAVSVDYASADGTATAGADFTAAGGTLNWVDGDTSAKNITVTVLDDIVFEGNETFSVALSNVTGGATLGMPNAATVTINDGDAQPTFTIDNVSMNEGASGTTNFVFTVTKTGMTAGTSSVDYATADGSATVADSDYVATSGTINFTAAQTSQEVTVQVNGDTKFEQDENFTVVLSNVMNDRGQRVEGAPAGGVGTIVNDDAQPTFTIDNVSMNEGASGTTNFVFTVTKTGITAGTSSVDYATADGSATVADSDYVATAGGR